MKPHQGFDRDYASLALSLPTRQHLSLVLPLRYSVIPHASLTGLLTTQLSTPTLPLKDPPTAMTLPSRTRMPFQRVRALPTPPPCQVPASTSHEFHLTIHLALRSPPTTQVVHSPLPSPRRHPAFPSRWILSPCLIKDPHGPRSRPPRRQPMQPSASLVMENKIPLPQQLGSLTQVCNRNGQDMTSPCALMGFAVCRYRGSSARGLRCLHAPPSLRGMKSSSPVRCTLS